MGVDVMVSRSGELDVAGVDGVSEAGVEFVDSWMDARGRYIVVDAGRLIVQTGDIGALVEAARAAALVVDERDVL